MSTTVAAFSAHTLKQRTTTATINKALLALTMAKMVNHLAKHKIPTFNLAQNIGHSLSRLEEGILLDQDLHYKGRQTKPTNIHIIILSL